MKIQDTRYKDTNKSQISITKQFGIFNLSLVSCLLLGICFLFLTEVPSAHAEEIGLGATENLFDIALFPGESYTDEVTIFNQSPNLALPVSAQLNLWNLKEDSDDIEFVRAQEALNATKWFTFEEGTDFVLTPRGTEEEAKTVNFTVTPPENTPPGSYFVMMRYQAVIPPHYFTNEGPRTIPEVGILFFIKVGNLALGADTPDYAAQITSLNAKDVNPLPLSASFLPKAEAGVFEKVIRKMTANIKNEGIYHFTTEGNIEIKNMFGRTIASAELPGKIMLPDRERSFDIEVIKDANFWQRNMRTGFYTATMTLNLPESDFSVVKTTTFWVFPWKFISAIIVLLFFITEFRKRIFKAGKVLFKGEKINS